MVNSFMKPEMDSSSNAKPMDLPLIVQSFALQY